MFSKRKLFVSIIALGFIDKPVFVSLPPSFRNFVG